ncbi:uncharacterized protein K444DRAFT_666973 [Hyaloscypha bicolor E]|uniref:Uncharacterized protein n=1 Tax=Hyaloscypha bicolor E TaxID=1095630 RepID=A0A2J6SWC3_9HELO|nr:uncharacterized protein K444DRAFT_666973 [Hyaloscypha bicolor E]PMD55074.1 hypothetical protein K444DRAFT_666973 [Hyaloscypha bicolor E]
MHCRLNGSACNLALDCKSRTRLDLRKVHTTILERRKAQTEPPNPSSQRSLERAFESSNFLELLLRIRRNHVTRVDCNETCRLVHIQDRESDPLRTLQREGNPKGKPEGMAAKIKRTMILRMNGAGGEGSQGSQPGNDDDPVRRYFQVNGVGPRDKF